MAMEKPDFLSYAISFLKDQDYPLVHTMSPEEIADVFHLSNRCFLVSWALTLLDEDSYGKALKEREIDESLLAELVCCHGFCTNTEKTGFFNGELPVEEQLQILYRMFQFIERQKQAAQLTDVELVTLDDLYTLKNKDLNLFPLFGEMKNISEKDRQDKIREVEMKMEQLNLEQVQVKERVSLLMSEDKKGDHDIILRDINEYFSHFDRVMDVVARDAATRAYPNYKIDPASVELLEACNECLKHIVQHLNNLQTINEFVVAGNQNQMPIDEITPLVEVLSDQLRKIRF